jgi:hypothetical protein
MLPNILNPPKGESLFPPTVFSNHVTLSLPHPLPLKVSRVRSCSATLSPVDPVPHLFHLQISSLPLYSMTFALARHGMHGKLRFIASKLTSILTPISSIANNILRLQLFTRILPSILNV